MRDAPYNEIAYGGRRVPILCTPGTLGYHLHPSHHTEVHDKSIWDLPPGEPALPAHDPDGPLLGRGV